jgi:uncharacterized protein (TIGR02145 family)
MWEKGICWCTTNNPTKTKMKGFSLNTKDTGSYECALTGLLPNTTYYVRAFATNHEGTAYGNEISFKTQPTVTDFDGNVYHTVRIGDQVWMAENLKVTKYRNGDPIPEVANNEWGDLTTGAWCELHEPYNKGYGKLYNFYALLDVRYLAPEGWHVATDEDWKTLEGTVDSQYPVGDVPWDLLGERGSDAGGNLKSTTDPWIQPNVGATDKYGFSALPGGYRDWNYGGFLTCGEGAHFWTSTEYIHVEDAYYRAIFNNSSRVVRYHGSKQGGGSVRCVKD